MLCECDEIEPAGRPGLAWWILYMVCQQQQQLPAGFLEQMSDKPLVIVRFFPPPFPGGCITVFPGGSDMIVGVLSYIYIVPIR